MDDLLQAGILTIGTEVSTGQILNRNTAWIANQLNDLRMNPAWHLSVADLKGDMLDALRFLQSKTKLIIVTGGLGPTSDDFTRHIIGEWAKAPLVFDEASWQHVIDRFISLGVPTAPESNRQQCFFPTGSRILNNRKGTAHGFRIEANGVLCFVLPGPPEEIKAIWQDHIRKELSQRSAQADALELFRWHCLGLSESKLGEMVEELIQGSSLVAGYRPHLPYVEIKIWCKTSQRDKEQPTLDRIDAAIARWVMGKDDEDLLDRLMPILERFDEVVIDDQASLGAISQRLGQKWTPDFPTKLTISDYFTPKNKIPDISGRNKLHLILGALDAEGSWDIWYKTSEMQKLQTLKLPFQRNTKRMDRERLYVCELSLAAFSRLADKGNLIL